MRLNVNEAAVLLDKPADTIYRWIESGDLPAYRVNEQFRINSTELLEWAILRNIALGPEVFHDEDSSPVEVRTALARGGVKRLNAVTRAHVLQSVTKHLEVPAEDQAMLQDLLVARDKAAFVSVPHGVAIPHVRHPIVLAAEPQLHAFFLTTPVEFIGAPVRCLFVQLTPTVRTHLQLLARLSYLLRDEQVKDAIRLQDDRLAHILADIEERLE